jgi:hypothetical protein
MKRIFITKLKDAVTCHVTKALVRRLPGERRANLATADAHCNFFIFAVPKSNTGGQIFPKILSVGSEAKTTFLKATLTDGKTAGSNLGRQNTVWHPRMYSLT